MNHKENDLLNQLKKFPKYQMDKEKQQKIYNNIMQKHITRTPTKSKLRRRKRIIANLASIVAFTLIVVLGLSYFSSEESSSTGNNGQNSPSATEEDDSNIQDYHKENYEDLGEHKNKDEIRDIIDKTLREMNSKVDDIIDTHSEWVEKFRLLHEGNKEYPDEFYEAVNVFKNALDSVMTDRALNEFTEGLILQSFCECDVYHRWSEEDTKNNFQVKEQTENEFVATSKIDGTEMFPDSWTFEWHFKKEDGRWKIEDVKRIDIDK